MIKEIVIADDDQSIFWSLYQNSAGTLSVTLSDVTSPVAIGVNSLKIVLATGGSYTSVGLQKDLGVDQNWMDTVSYSFYFWGSNTGNTWVVYCRNRSDYTKGFNYIFYDQWYNWKKITIPVESFNAYGVPAQTWANIGMLFFVTGQQGTAYIDRVTREVYSCQGLATQTTLQRRGVP